MGIDITKVVLRNGSLEISGVDNTNGEPIDFDIDDIFAGHLDVYKRQELYRIYKHSVPSERSESKSCRYFMALPEKSLNDDAMLFGERRDKAQVELELYVLCQILGGIKWNPETMGKWFWPVSYTHLVGAVHFHRLFQGLA